MTLFKILNMTEKQQSAIDEIMDDFNFNKVHKAMKELNWQWRDIGVPDEYDLRVEARRLLKEAIKNKFSIATGGFEAAYQDQYGESLTLKFVLESSIGDLR
jgi:Spy/CpxP family protein refolding chaperone